MSKIYYEIKRVNGANILSEIARRGVEISSCKTAGKTLSFCVDKRQSKIVEKSLNTRLLEYKKCENKGFFANLFSVTRLGIFLTLFFSLLLYFFLSQFLFFTEIYGLDKVSVFQVEKHLQSLGVHGVVARDKINEKELEKSLMESFSFSVVSVKIQGATLVLSVKEELSPPVYEPSLKQSLYATENAVITRMVTISGTAKVKVGKSVKKGEMLIENQKTVGDLSVPVRAVGEVYGKVWRETEIFIPEEKEVFVDTGNLYTKTFFAFSNNFHTDYKPFDNCRLEDKITPFVLLPIYLHEITFFEQKIGFVTNPEYEDSAGVSKRACDELLLAVEGEGEILRTWSTERFVDGGKILKVVVEIEKRIEVYA